MTEPVLALGGTTIRLFTIGSSGRSAEEFFAALQNAGVKRVIDIRLNNASQLAGFTKKRDLVYFLRVIANIDYVHTPEFAPTKEMLDGYRKKRIDWDEYERRFSHLLQGRRPVQRLDRDDFHEGCLLCSEPKPDHCHRRLVAEYLKREWRGVKIQHL